MEYEGPPIKVHPIQAARVESIPEAKYTPISGVEVQAAAKFKAHFRRTHGGGRGPESNLWGLGVQTRPRSKVQFPGKQRPLGPVTRVPGARGPGVQCPCYPAERPGTDLRGQSPRSDF